LLACAALGCEWSTALQTDPASWSPPASDASEIDAADTIDAAGTIDPDCKVVLPPFDSTLQTSTATSMSHAPGVGCLGSCHGDSGGNAEARTIFAAAGTVYRSQTSKEPVATGGAVHGVGGMTLPVDLCGNFYVVRGALTLKDLQSTQPFVQNPTVHRMEKLLTAQNNPGSTDNLGSCNQAGCHDFSSPLKWGIYY
jgi:hypothetical protein